jgi:hypothetical protein
MLYPQVVVPTFSMPKVESLVVVQLTPRHVGVKPCT